MEESGQGANLVGRGGNPPAPLPSSVSLFGILCLNCAANVLAPSALSGTPVASRSGLRGSPVIFSTHADAL